MMETELDFTIARLGERRIPSPMTGIRFVGDNEHVLYNSQSAEIRTCLEAGREPSCHLDRQGEILSPGVKARFLPLVGMTKCSVFTLFASVSITEGGER